VTRRWACCWKSQRPIFDRFGLGIAEVDVLRANACFKADEYPDAYEAA